MEPPVVVYWDLETTGLSVYEEQIIQLGAVDASGRTFVRCVRSTAPVSAFITGLTGVTQAAVTAAEPWPAVAAAFEAWLATLGAGPVTLVAFNGERFDVPLLLEECRRHGLALDAPVWSGARFFDPDRWRRTGLYRGPGATGGLGEAYKACFAGETFANAHDALGDALALQRLCVEGFRLAPDAAGWTRGPGSQSLDEARLRQLRLLVCHRVGKVRDWRALAALCAARPEVFAPHGPGKRSGGAGAKRQREEPSEAEPVAPAKQARLAPPPESREEVQKL